VIQLVKILGYYIDKDCKPSPSTIFVAIHSDDELSCYAPVGQHSKLDSGYMEECTEITREEYLEISKGFYTPADYIGDNNDSKKFIFTIEVHNAEYTEGLDEFGNVLPDDEESFGELDDVTALIDFQYVRNKKELDEHIQYLSNQYRVEPERVSYQQVLEPEDVVWEDN
jgi:hypothetical protein